MTSTRRLLFVHAHPDDESINNGATMAKYAAEGAQVTLVTCTRGEQGEVIPERLAHLAAGFPGETGAGACAGAGPGAGAGAPGDGLGDHRVGELAQAMQALGVTDHRFLGDPVTPGRRASEVLASGGTVYRDSGMAYDHDGGVVPSPDQPAGAFAPMDAGESIEPPAEQLAAVIRELRPQVVVSYEPGGGYGHPDHVRTHLVTMRAVELAGLAGPAAEAPVPGWAVPKVYWVVMPETLTRATLSALATAEGPAYRGLDPAGRLPSMVVADDQVTTAIDAMAFAGAKVAALRAHATQVEVSPDGTFYALSNGIRHPVQAIEFYHLAKGPASSLPETDFFQ